MIPKRTTDVDDIEESDVIDLTKFYRDYGSFNFPIRPPSPFADNPIQSNEEKSTHINPNQTEDSTSSSSSTASTIRRAISKILKRIKSTKQKKTFSPPSPSTTDESYPYDFGIGLRTRTNSSSSRNPIKRVHWIDDDELIINASHRFLQYLKLFIENILNEKTEEFNSLKNCRISLNELQSLIDCQEIQNAFDDLIQLVEKEKKNQLQNKLKHIEDLVLRTVLFSSA